MKKFFTPILVAVMCIAASVSCTVDNHPEPGPEPEKEALQAPEISIGIEAGYTVTASWAPVTNASSYRWEFDGSTDETSQNSITFHDIDKGTYTLRVKAIPGNDSLYTESGWAEKEITLNDFTITAEMDGNLTLHVTIIPADPDMIYYREAFDDIQYEEMGGNATDVWTNALQSYINIFGSQTLGMIASRGTDSFTVQCSYEETTYVLVAGIDGQLNRITDVTEAQFYAGDVPPSDNTFSVAVEDITSSSAVVYITPSNSDPFSMVLVESEDIAGYTDDDLDYLLRTVYAPHIEDGNIFTQAMSMTYKEGTLSPDTEHTVLVFGWNGVPSTEITKKTFRTEKATSGEGLTFDISAEVIGPYEIHAVIEPSDPSAQYICFPVTTDVYEQYKEDLPQYIRDICDTFGIPVSMYMEMFVGIGKKDIIFDNWDYDIQPGTSYIIWAAGVDINGDDVVFYDSYIHDEILTTPEQ